MISKKRCVTKQDGLTYVRKQVEGRTNEQTADALTADTISSHLLGWKAIDRGAIKGVGCKIM